MLPNRRRTLLIAASSSGVLTSISVHAQPAIPATQGVTKNEILLGSIQDLSGPIALYGKFIRNGMLMRAEEENEAGGIHGRKIKLLVEDSGYDPKKALLAADKLIGRDKVFAIVGTLGTTVMMASMPKALEKGVIHAFPLAAARESYEPLHPLKFANFAPYFDAIRTGTKWLVKEKNAKRVGILYQDDDFGSEILQGAEAGLKDIGLALVEKTSYKRGATDFASQIARLKAAGAQIIVLGTTLRETVGAMAEAKKVGWSVEMIATHAAHSALVTRLGKEAVEGLYTTAQTPIAYPDDATTEAKRWIDNYRKRYNEEYESSATAGYIAMDLFIRGLQGAGPQLTNLGWAKAMEKVQVPRDIFRGSGYSFSPTKHLGGNRIRMTQVRGNRFVNVTDFLDN